MAADAKDMEPGFIMAMGTGIDIGELLGEINCRS